MLDIPELDAMICRQLTRDDLTQCARVSKKWHAIVIPHLWADLTWKNYTLHIVRLRRLMEADYEAEQQCRKSKKDGHRKGQPASAQSSHRLTAFSKYGHWIRLLPNPDYLGQNREPVLHVFKRCSPDVRVESFTVAVGDMDLEPCNLERAIVDFTLPRVHHLSFPVDLTPFSPGDSNLMDVLDQDDCVLEKLEIRVGIREPNTGTKHVEGEPIDNLPKICTSLKELVLDRYTDDPDAEAFWSSLFRRCGRVEKLQVDNCDGSAQGLVQSMLAYMPNLREITLGKPQFPFSTMPNDIIATLLSGSCNGWKVVRLRTEFGKETIDALSKHSSTLELLDSMGCGGNLSGHLSQVLSSCANLHAILWSASDPLDWRYCTRINYEAFIDLDRDTWALKPWECEASLKELKVFITSIPRPDLEQDDAEEEAYPGEARMIQSRVYDRLARFTNLEILWLGGIHPYTDSRRLDMSLESGLSKLSGLEKLREFHAGGSEPRISIGIKEVQWMVANWPELRAVYGVLEDEANAWLKENTDILLDACINMW